MGPMLAQLRAWCPSFLRGRKRSLAFAARWLYAVTTDDYCHDTWAGTVIITGAEVENGGWLGGSGWRKETIGSNECELKSNQHWFCNFGNIWRATIVFILLDLFVNWTTYLWCIKSLMLKTSDSCRQIKFLAI